jgi:hypothetical protein
VGVEIGAKPKPREERRVKRKTAVKEKDRDSACSGTLNASLVNF